MTAPWLWDLFLVLLGAFGAICLLYFSIVRIQGRIEAKQDSLLQMLGIIANDKIDIKLVDHKANTNAERIQDHETRITRAEISIDHHVTGS